MPDHPIFDRLEAQYEAFDRTLEGLDPEGWSGPTLCENWDVRDLVCHLMLQAAAAHASITGDDSLMDGVPDDLTRFDDWVDRYVQDNRHLSSDQVWGRWRGTRAQVVETLRAAPGDQQIRWTVMRMRPVMLGTLLATDAWAHHNDVRIPLGLPRQDGPVLQDVALLAWKALPWACAFVGEDYAPVRFELTGPDDEQWTFGDGDEGSVLRGDALELCQIAVKRQDPADATTITTEGEAAQAALRAVRCFP